MLKLARRTDALDRLDIGNLPFSSRRAWASRQDRPKIGDGEVFVGRPDRQPLRSLESCAQNSSSPPAPILAVVYPTNIPVRLSMRGTELASWRACENPGPQPSIIYAVHR